MKQMTYNGVTIIRIPVNPIFRAMQIHLYLIDGVLIDTGPEIWKLILARSFRSKRIEQVALTHHHADHSGMARWIYRKLSVPVFYHERKLTEIRKKNSQFWYSATLSGNRRLVHTSAYPDVIQTNNYKFYPIETPGHTPDHVALLEPEKGWLFTGDLYITPHPKVFTKQESISDYIESLKKLRTVDYDTIFCAHEGVIQNGKTKMEEKLTYLERTRLEVIRLHKLGYSDRIIVKKLFPGKVRLERATFHSFSRLKFIRSCYRE